MVGDHQRYALVTVHFAPELAQRLRRSGEPLCRKGTYCQQDLRSHQLDLALEQRGAGLDFVGQRIAVPRGAALEHVADVHRLLPRQGHGGQHEVQELAGPADEGNTGGVLVGSRRFPHHHEASGRVAVREDHGIPALGKTAARTCQGRFAQFLHDKASDRQELLRHLLELGVYSRMGEEARKRASEARVRLDELERQLEAEVPTEEQVAGLAASAEEAKTAQAELASVMGDVSTISDEFDAARLEVERFTALLGAAAAATVPEAVREFAGRMQSAGEAFAEAEAEYSRTRTGRSPAPSRRGPEC